MKPLLTLILILLFCAPLCAQDKAPTEEQQAEFTRALTSVEMKRRELEAAQARAEAAQSALEAVVMRLMAVLRLSPEEWRPVVREGRLAFEKVEKKPVSP